MALDEGSRKHHGYLQWSAKGVRLAVELLAVALLLAAILACNGEKAQDFEVNLFDGDRFLLSDRHEDSVVVVNFWYPSCPPCREEMPEFQRAWEQLAGEPVVFLGMFVPRGLDNEYAAREFVEELGLTFNFATDRGEAIATAYGIEFYPTTVFIDRGGRVAETWVSALDTERITAIAKELLDG